MTVIDFAERQRRAGLRPLPNNAEAEEALLGAILINNDAYYRVADFLLPEHFFDPANYEIYDKCSALICAGKSATPVTLKTFVSEDMNAYLAQLCAEATTILNAGDYGKVIYDLSRRRSLISVAERMAEAAYNSPVDDSPEDQIEDAEKALFEVAEIGKYGTGFAPFSQAAAKAMQMIARARERDDGLSGLATGLIDLDVRMGGLQASDLIILAARPGMGKTALATNIAYNVANAGKYVGFFSLEMSEEQLATRIFAEQTNIPSTRMRRGGVDQVDYEQIVRTATDIQNLPLYIDECGGLNISQIAARARRLKRMVGLDLLVIDYLQLASGTSRRSSQNRVAEITEITTRLKALAKELNAPILALSQLSRAVEQREDKRPQLTDLRDSGSIEQDADVVLFVHRDEYYYAMKKPPPRDDTEKFMAWVAEGEDVIGKAELIIAKQRHGPIGVINLQFNAAVTRFANLAEQNS